MSTTTWTALPAIYELNEFLKGKMMRIGRYIFTCKNILANLQETPKRGARVTTIPEVFHERTKEIDLDEVLPMNVRPYKDIPGPKALPIIGNNFRFVPYIGEYGDKTLLEQLRMLRDTYGDIVKLDGLLNRQPHIILYSPKLCEKMYRQQGIWPVRLAAETLRYYRDSRPDIYKGECGLTTSQGKSWYDFRSKVNPHLMHPQAVKPYIRQIDRVTQELVNRMRQIRDPVTLELSASFNNELSKWGLEGMCLIALNQRLGCLEHNLAKDSDPQIVIDCVHDLLDAMYQLEMKLSLWKICNTPNLKRLFRVNDKLNEIALKYIDLAKNKLEQEPVSDTEEASVLEKLLRVDEVTARVMALDMFTGGVDTTGNLAAALLYYLATNPEKQEKLREEATSKLKMKSLPVTADCLKENTYVKACIKEALRLFPSIMGTARCMPTDITLGGYLIPKGSNVFACHSVMSTDPREFVRPHEFIPERWLKGKNEYHLANDAHPFTYLPFGYGTRTCIGKRFAEMEMEVLALKIIRNYKLEWHHGPLLSKGQIINVVTTPMQLKVIDL